MNWHKDLALAISAAAVIDLVNEYLAILPDSGHIPEELRPPAMTNAADIDAWHIRLSDAVAEVPRPNLLLQDLCVVFVRASARLAELAATQPANGDPDAACG